MAIYTSKFTQQEIDDGIDNANHAVQPEDLASYLPLAGGTMSGTLVFSNNSDNIQFNEGCIFTSGGNYVLPNDELEHSFQVQDKNRSPLFWVYNDGQLFSKKAVALGDRNDNTYCLVISYVNNVPSIQALKQNVGFNFNFALAPNGGNVGVGTTSPSYKLHVTAQVAATSFVNTSDIRKKDILENLELNVEDVANAPLFKFSWLDPEMPEGVNVGTSAQYWQTIIPEIVSEANDDEKTLSMQYGVAGLASSIALARKVVEQEKTIKAQEARIKALEDAIAEIQNKLK